MQDVKAFIATPQILIFHPHVTEILWGICLFLFTLSCSLHIWIWQHFLSKRERGSPDIGGEGNPSHNELQNINARPDLTKILIRDSLSKILIFILEEFEGLKGEIKTYLKLLSSNDGQVAISWEVP